MADSCFGCRRGQVCALSFEARVAAGGAIQTQFLESTPRSRREVCAKARQTSAGFVANPLRFARNQQRSASIDGGRRCGSVPGTLVPDCFAIVFRLISRSAAIDLCAPHKSKNTSTKSSLACRAVARGRLAAIVFSLLFTMAPPVLLHCGIDCCFGATLPISFPHYYQTCFR
jgi:hypothetical protein